MRLQYAAVLIVGLATITPEDGNAVNEAVAAALNPENTSTTWHAPKQTVNIAAIAITAVLMGIVLLFLIFDIVCIVKRARRTLTPRFSLVVNVFQTFFFVVLFGLSMTSPQSPASIAISVVVL